MLHSWNGKPNLEPPAPPCSLVRLWEKDPSVTDIGNAGTVTVLLEGKIETGPQSRDITIEGRREVKPDSKGDFLLTPINAYDFDTVQSFAYVHRVLNMYRRACQDGILSGKLTWQWGNEAITIKPDAGEMENAYYDRQSKSLNFFHFTNPKNGRTIYTCRAEDIVAHETGHAILDSLRPGYLESYLPQTGAMHEAFGDITSIFLLIDDLQTCEQIILKSKGNLLEPSLYLPDLANQFGNAIGQHNGLRNANNNLTLSEVGQEVHSMSQVFSGAIYKSLAFMVQNRINSNKESMADTLHKCGKEFMHLLLKSFVKSPEQNASFADIANNMMYYTQDKALRAFIKQEFLNREVELTSSPTVDMNAIEQADYSQCRGTLNTESAIELRAQALDKLRLEQKIANERYLLNPARLLWS